MAAIVQCSKKKEHTKINIEYIYMYIYAVYKHTCLMQPNILYHKYMSDNQDKPSCWKIHCIKNSVR